MSKRKAADPEPQQESTNPRPESRKRPRPPHVIMKLKRPEIEEYSARLEASVTKEDTHDFLIVHDGYSDSKKQKSENR